MFSIISEKNRENIHNNRA